MVAPTPSVLTQLSFVVPLVRIHCGALLSPLRCFTIKENVVRVNCQHRTTFNKGRYPNNTRPYLAIWMKRYKDCSSGKRQVRDGIDRHRTHKSWTSLQRKGIEREGNGKKRKERKKKAGLLTSQRLSFQESRSILLAGRPLVNGVTRSIQ